MFWRNIQNPYLGLKMEVVCSSKRLHSVRIQKTIVCTHVIMNISNYTLLESCVYWFMYICVMDSSNITVTKIGKLFLMRFSVNIQSNKQLEELERCSDLLIFLYPGGTFWVSACWWKWCANNLSQMWSAATGRVHRSTGFWTTALLNRVRQQWHLLSCWILRSYD